MMCAGNRQVAGSLVAMVIHLGRLDSSVLHSVPCLIMMALDTRAHASRTAPGVSWQENATSRFPRVRRWKCIVVQWSASAMPWVSS